MKNNWLTKIVLSDRTQHLSNKYSLPIEEVQNLLQYDPTKGKCLEWITKNYKSQQLRFPEDGSKTIEILTTFTKLHPILKRNNVPTDINLYSYSDLVKLIEQYGGQKSKREQYKINEIEGVKELLDFPPYKAVQILTPEASAKLCRDTQWCVKDPKFFNRYSNNLIMILKDGEPYYLIHEESGQYKDKYDQGLMSYDKTNPEALEVLRALYNSGIVDNPIGFDFGTSAVRIFPEDKIAKDARLSYLYALFVLEGRFELGEPAIAEDVVHSYSYAHDVLEGRFELGEPTIIKSSRHSYYYAKTVLKSRFELGEPAIATVPLWSYEYAQNVLKGRFELGEETIAEDPKYSCWYARDVIKGRFELAEPTIAEEPGWSFIYARDVLNGRFELGETAIAKDGDFSYLYAMVINDRFELGESAIRAYSIHKDDYIKFLHRLGKTNVNL